VYADSRSKGKPRGRSLRERYDKDELRHMAKEGYMNLAKENHPDRGGDTEKMTRINQVYDRTMKLIDPRNSDVWR